MKRTLCAVGLGSLCLMWAAPGRAVVLCAKKSGVVLLRTACKKKETPVDLAQLGAVGPKGDPGPQGNPGPKGDPGPQGNPGQKGESSASVPCLSQVGTEVFFTGCNVNIQSGSGATDGNVNGLGNLIVGYNANTGGHTRTGSHNLIVGDEHEYSSFGGLVAGLQNTVAGPWASVSGGNQNTASGTGASVSGGVLNTASETQASVSGGFQNTASGMQASVSGGAINTASGSTASVSGGFRNTASGGDSWVSGGSTNTANQNAAKNGTLTGTAIADPTIPNVAGEPGATFVFSQILGINDKGIAVGYYGDSTTSQHGFLYNTKTNQYTFLDDPSEAFNNGVEVTQITGITNSGEITGFYSDANGVFHGFVATAPRV